MLRVLFYLAIVAALGFGFAWLADRPGELDVTFAGNHYNVPLITAVAGIVAIVAAMLMQSGRKELARIKGLPRTTDTVSKIPNALKGNEEENR